MNRDLFLSRMTSHLPRSPYLRSAMLASVSLDQFLGVRSSATFCGEVITYEDNDV